MGAKKCEVKQMEENPPTDWEMKLNNALSAILLSQAAKREETLLLHKEHLTFLIKQEMKEFSEEILQDDGRTIWQSIRQALKFRGITEEDTFRNA